MGAPDSRERDHLRHAFNEAAETLAAFMAEEGCLSAVEEFARRAAEVLDRGGQILACGNGGSLSDAMHFTEELVGRFRGPRRALAAIALADPATLTCIGNDFGFEAVFARQVEAIGRPGDLLLALSTTGESPNVIRAVQTARDRDLTTVGLTGLGGGKLATEVDVAIVVPHATTPDRIQEVHLQILHVVIEAIERRACPEAMRSR